jgi:predicted histidine transporter YuiF (NhaC family)
MSSTSVGLAVTAAGLVIILVGILITIGAFSWFGHLPGGVRIERDSARIFIPITSMLLLSILLTVVVNIVRRLLG